MAAGAPVGITASVSTRHGSHVQDRQFHMRKPDHSNVQISNNQPAFDSTKQIHDLLADIDAAASSRMDQCKTAMQKTIPAAPAATMRAHPVTARDPKTAVRNPQTTAKATCATAAVSSVTLEGTDLNSKVTACILREDDGRGPCSTAVAALPPSAMDMDDHFCRWQCIARQNQSTGFRAYPPLPYWAALIAPYPACEMKADRYRTRFWVKF